MIEIKGLSKNYGSVKALQPLNLRLSVGKTHVCLGSSGCGKSTLLRLICGLIEPTEGEVIINGKKVSTSSQRKTALNIGYVIQEGGLFPHLTAKENIELAAKVNGWNKINIKKRRSYLMELMTMKESLLEKFPKQLSGGQRQRFSLMRALMLDPEIILMDEPLGALDPVVRSHLQIELKDIFEKLNKTVVMVTHDVWEGAFLGDTISLFDQGQLLQHGKFSDLMTSPANSFVSSFLKAQWPPKEVMEWL